MANKNSLGVIPKSEHKNILTSAAKSSAGRKKKDPAQKESELVSLFFLPSEYETLVKKAGPAKVSAYIKHMIRTETNWLED